MWDRLQTFMVLFGGGMLLALGFHYVQGAVLHEAYPRDTFLFNPVCRFNDLTESWIQAKAGRPYVQGQSAAVATWFPIAYLVFYAVRAIQAWQLVLGYLLLTFGLALSGVAAFFYSERTWWRRDPRAISVVVMLCGLALLNYPVLFAVDRGNLDPICMWIMFGGLQVAQRSKRLVPGFLIGVAASVKGYPIAAVLPLIREGRFVATGLACATAIGLVVLPGLVFEGGIRATLLGLQQGLALFHQGYVIGDHSAHYSADWLNAIRLLIQRSGVAPDMVTIYHHYVRCLAVFVGVLAFHVLFVAGERWRQLLGATIIMLTFPHVAGDYKIVFLLPAVLAWLSSRDRGWRSKLFGISAALLFVPKHFYFFTPNGFLKLGEASISCVINPMLVLMLAVVLWPTASEWADVPRNLRVFGKRLIRPAQRLWPRRVPGAVTTP